MTDVNRTRSGYMKIAPINKDALIERARTNISKALEGVNDPTARLEALSKLTQAAEDDFDKYRDPMFARAVSLTVYDGVRAVNNAIAVQRTEYSERIKAALGNWEDRPQHWNETVAERARAHNVPEHENAITELPPLAEKVVYARLLIKQARPIRNDLITALSEKGVTRVSIAGIIGKEPSRVSHIALGRKTTTEKVR